MSKMACFTKISLRGAEKVVTYFRGIYTMSSRSERKSPVYRPGCKALTALFSVV